MKMTHWEVGGLLMALLWMAPLGARAATVLSDNLSSTSGGTEAAADSTWLAASFGTDSSGYNLADVILSIGNLTSSSVSAQAAIYSDDGLGEPASLVSILTSSGSYSTSLSEVTFSASGVSLSADTTYWVVLSTTSGELDWSYAADDNGTGSGFQDRWAESFDAGSTWYTYSSVYNTGVDPLQMEVTADATSVATPEPGTLPLLLIAGSLSLYLARRRKARS